MEKIKNFKEFMNENDTLGGIDMENIEKIQSDEDFQENSDMEIDSEPEEITDLLELVYDKETETWNNIGELDLPTDFDIFYEWFIGEINDDISTTASMKEEGDEIVFHIPEDLYITFLEDIDNGGNIDLDNEEIIDNEIDIDNEEDDDDWE